MTLLDAQIYWLSKQSTSVYLFFGGGTGFAASVFENHGTDILKTFILGASGALGGGLIKLLIDLIAKGAQRKIKMSAWEKEHYEILKRKEQEQLLLKREEHLTKNGL